MAQQIALLFNFGFDTTVLRNVASRSGAKRSELVSVVGNRLLLAVIICIVWAVVANVRNEDTNIRFAWYAGLMLVIALSINTGSFYQGLHKFPLYTGIASLGSASIGLIYLLTFIPGENVGADIKVYGMVTFTSALVALVVLITRRSNFVPQSTLSIPDIISDTKILLVTSWRYWALSIVTYIYSVFPLLIISHFINDDAVGQYRAAFLMASGLELLFGSINNLMLPKLINLRLTNRENFWAYVVKVAIANTILGLAAFICLASAAPMLLGFALGDQYIQAVDIFKILVFGRSVVFVGQIFAWALIAQRNDSIFLGISTVGSALSILLNLAVVEEYGAIGVAIVSVLVEIMIHVACYLGSRKNDSPVLV